MEHLINEAAVAIKSKEDMLRWVLSQEDYGTARKAFHKARQLVGVAFVDTLAWTK